KELTYVMATSYSSADFRHGLEAGLAGNEEAQLLRIPTGSSVLFTRRTTYTDRNQPIEYAKAVYCGNKYTFYTHLKREQLVP
ncbi:MAG TPA: GntR family transcriptional regulator, partial [Ktedonobacter sp.]|nr:GntR family transcriptional regulator [Ktedonobacter sp.]